MSVKRNRARGRGRWAFVLGLGAAAVLVGVSAIRTPALADYTDGIVAADKISLEAALRIWRKAAWQEDDYLSEIKLGDIYGDETGDNKYYDPIESYVWYYLAIKSDRADAYVDDPRALRIAGHDLHRATQRLNDLLVLLNAEQRQEARDRIVYILSCRGADGYLKLGEIHSTLAFEPTEYGPTANENDVPAEEHETGLLRRVWDALLGVRAQEREHAAHAANAANAQEHQQEAMGILTNSVIVRNDGEALMYYHIADNMGHPLGKFYVRTLNEVVRNVEGDLAPRIVADATEKAKYWSPPYEYYPPGQTTSGIPHTDECYIDIEKQKALVLAASIPRASADHALAFLGWGAAAARYQATLLDQPTGHLTASETVHLIQTAALRGDAASQNTLGVMYAKGYGVPRNYVRAERWFKKAADQRYAAALYHLGVLYKAGPEGIRQDLSKSNDYMTQSALAGFRPTMNQLQDLLVRAESAPRRPGQH